MNESIAVKSNFTNFNGIVWCCDKGMSGLFFFYLIINNWRRYEKRAVWKKNIILGVFSASYKITIGADFALKTLEWDDTTKINLQLWDIAGHERFGYLTGVYYRYA